MSFVSVFQQKCMKYAQGYNEHCATFESFICLMSYFLYIMKYLYPGNVHVHRSWTDKYIIIILYVQLRVRVIIGASGSGTYEAESSLACSLVSASLSLSSWSCVSVISCCSSAFPLLSRPSWEERSTQRAFSPSRLCLRSEHTVCSCWTLCSRRSTGTEQNSAHTVTSMSSVRRSRYFWDRPWYLEMRSYVA